MSYSRAALLFLSVSMGLADALVRASGPTFWTTATAADLLKGTSDGVYVSTNGVVSAGPQLTNQLASTPAQIWSVRAAPDGTLWAGTGGDGRVIRVRPGQAEETVFTAEESNVFALALSDGRVYAASSPDGRVYAIESDGSARTFFNPEEKYIWALSMDPEGRLWVGAGNPAVIYRVAANGTSEVVYRPPAAHVVTLARDASGRLLAGTESPGRLYRFDAADRPFVLLDAGAAEVHAVSGDADGVLFAAVVLQADDASSEGEAAVALAASTDADGATEGARRSALYRIDPNGTWEAVWTTEDTIYDVAVETGGVLVATGPAGRLYKISSNRDVQLLTGVDARQITRFLPGSPSQSLVAFATANPGRLMAVGGGEQSTASYVSAVRDTNSASTWGLIRWEATGSVALQTRSGNTEKPDDSWSEWSVAYTRREGEAVTSPPARFVQWRAVLMQTASTSAPRLTAVTVAYLPANSRPVVSAVTTYPPGVVFQRPFANEDGAIAGLDDAVAIARRAPGDPGPTPPAPGRRMFRRGLQTISWNAEDSDDGDRLEYSLEYRREGADVWRALRDGLSDTIYVWDTTSAPDGRYVVRIRAGDSPSNTADRALAGERESDLIEIDNTPPTLTTETVLEGTSSRLVVIVVDGQSPIQKVEYSPGGGPWQLLYPTDGLADALEERYEITLAEGMDAATIIVRATDLLQNVVTQPAIR